MSVMEGVHMGIKTWMGVALGAALMIVPAAFADGHAPVLCFVAAISLWGCVAAMEMRIPVVTGGCRDVNVRPQTVVAASIQRAEPDDADYTVEGMWTTAEPRCEPQRTSRAVTPPFGAVHEYQEIFVIRTVTYTPLANAFIPRLCAEHPVVHAS